MENKKNKNKKSDAGNYKFRGHSINRFHRYTSIVH